MSRDLITTPDGLVARPELAVAVPAEWDASAQASVPRNAASSIFLVAEQAFELMYGPEERAAIAARVSVDPYVITPQIYQSTSDTWPEVEMLFTGWGMVTMDEAFFRRFPKLKAVFYAAGTVRAIVTDAFWERGILLTNAAAANAVPVCEYTLSQILFALKHGWQKALYIRRHHKYPSNNGAPGAYQSTVGLVSLGEIGRLVAERLRQFDLRVVAYDPYFSADEALGLGVELLPLDEIFAVSDVVSCHTPWLKETEKMIRGEHFKLMKDGATFVNTARGQVVDESEMIAVLADRPDLFAVLDVTERDEPAPDSPLYTLDNVLLTPHIAGSLGRECHRLGKLMVEELDRYLAGEPLRYRIDRERFKRSA